MDNIQLNNNGQTVEIGEAKKMNFFQRVLGIVLSPGQTMKNLEEKPRILFPILAMIFSMPILYLLRFPLYQETIRKAIDIAMAQQANAETTPEQIDTVVKISSITGLIGAPIGILVVWLITTAILFGIVKIFKGEGSFKQYCSITGYAYVITLIFLIVTFVASFLTNSIELDSSLMLLKDLIPTDSMSIFMKGFLLTILKSFDVFGIWYYIIIAIGVTSVSKLPKQKAYRAVIILFIISTLFSALYAGAMGSGRLM